MVLAFPRFPGGIRPCESGAVHPARGLRGPAGNSREPLMRRRSLPLIALSCGIAAPALGQPPWPQRPVTLVVPYVPGGPSDVLARALAAALAPAIGQPVVVENRTGANGAVAAGY